MIAYDARGKKLETAKSKLGASWLDDGEGVNTLATDEDRLTRVAISRKRRDDSDGIEHAGSLSRHDLTVVSEGWTSGDALPVHAGLELANGGTITNPVNSYQRLGTQRCQTDGAVAALDANPYARLANPGSTITITAGRVILADLSLADLASPVCSEGACATPVEDEACGSALSFTVYGDDADMLPDTLDILTGMVRPEDSEHETARAGKGAGSCCTEPAGASPAGVIAGEARSRPRPLPGYRSRRWVPPGVEEQRGRREGPLRWSCGSRR